MRRRTITITADDVDCQYCADSRTQGKCSNSICPYIKERIEAGVVTYEEAVLAIIPAGAKMKLRLPALIASYPGTMWIDDQHKNRMDYMNYQLGYVRKRNTPRYYAAMTLSAGEPATAFITEGSSSTMHRLRESALTTMLCSKPPEASILMQRVSHLPIWQIRKSSMTRLSGLSSTAF